MSKVFLCSPPFPDATCLLRGPCSHIADGIACENPGLVNGVRSINEVLDFVEKNPQVAPAIGAVMSF